MRQIRSERANVSTIICGTESDKTGHIYSVDEFGRHSYKNSIGFAAIGDGAWHAQSQFMFAQYDPLWTFTRALLLTYIAKRRAEVTPGVGTQSDLFFITPQGFTFIPMDLANALEESYQEITGGAIQRS